MSFLYLYVYYVTLSLFYVNYVYYVTLSNLQAVILLARQRR